MKTLSVRQPFAEQIFDADPAARKDVENRSWSTAYRGPLAIHAAAKIDRQACQELGLNPAELPTGCVIGIVDLLDCVIDSPSPHAELGLVHWLLANPRRLPTPLPCLGKLRLFEVDVTLEKGEPG